MNDIIDNRSSKLQEHITKILDSSQTAKFAVGFLFLSGLESLADKLTELTEVRLLAGGTDRKTIEELGERLLRKEMVEQELERDRFKNRTQREEIVAGASKSLERTLEMMDQTGEAEKLISTISLMAKEGRLKARIYTRGRLHAKAYIFDYKPEGHYEKGIAIVGSSNLSLSGLSHNTELNVVVHGDDNHAALSRWFEELWAESEEFDTCLVEELQKSWASYPATPWDIYMKTLFALVEDRLEEEDKREIPLIDDELTRTLADFQKNAVDQAVKMIRAYGGAFVADVVGLGKSYIGAAIVKHFERTDGVRPLIICPASLIEMWEGYNEKYELNARVLSMSMLKPVRENKRLGILDEALYKDRDFVLVDESHNFRHHTTLKYEALQDFLSRNGRRVCLVTATPRNKSARDIYNQIRLFHPDDITAIPIDPPNLKEFFKGVENGERRLQDLLVHILIRRTRRHILRYYGFAEGTDEPLRDMTDAAVASYLDGTKRAYVRIGAKKQFFPKRELETLRYSIEDSYEGLYEKIRHHLGRRGSQQYEPVLGDELTYARYGLWNYVKTELRELKKYRDLHRAGINLRGLIRVMLFKRFESSVHAFRESLIRLERIHEVFLKSMAQGQVPAGEDAQAILYESDRYEETELMDALERCTGSYPLEDFEADRLKSHIEADRSLIQKLIGMVRPICPAADDKLQTLIQGLRLGPNGNKPEIPAIPKQRGKVLIFTQFADTARYLYENINPKELRKDIECIYGTGKSKARMAARFAPRANPEVEFRPDPEVSILVATDVMSEGLNLQDGDVVVNYDLHWNPVRLIQRFGRIDRIGTENEVIYGFNFLPELALERNLGLTELLRERIKEINETIGLDAAILDDSEQLNEEAMYAIYEKKGEQLSLYESQGDLIDLNEAEELLRSLRAENPREYERIADLRDGIRSARIILSERTGQKFVYCRAGRFQQLFIVDQQAKIITREVPEILGRLRCTQDEATGRIPDDHNKTVAEVMRLFKREVTERRAQQRYSLSLTEAQKYVLRELRRFSGQVPEESRDLPKQILMLEDAFKKPLPAAIRKNLNFLRRNEVVGEHLVKELTKIYFEYGLHEINSQRRDDGEVGPDEYPRIVCSEGFV